MTRSITLLAALCAPALLLWLAAGFVFWNWNPGTWSEAARFYVALAYVAFTFPFAGFLLGGK